MAEKLRTSHDLIEFCGNSLTKSDYIKLWDKLEPIGITVDNLVNQFLHDLLEDDNSSGSDEREYIRNWFERVYSFYPDIIPFSDFLQDRCLHFEEFVKYYSAFRVYLSTGTVSTLSCLYPCDAEYAPDCYESIIKLNDLFNDYNDCINEYSAYLLKVYPHLDTFTEISKQVYWYRQKEECLNCALDPDDIPF